MTKISTKVGKYVVQDASGRLPEVPNGEVSLTLKQALGYERRAAHIVFCDAPKVGPAEMRFARKALALKQTELAKMLGVSAFTVSDWESSKGKITRQTQLAMRALLEQAKNGPAWPPEAWVTAERASEHPPASSGAGTFVIEIPTRTRRHAGSRAA